MNFHTLFCFLMVASAGAQASTEPDPHSYAEPDKVTVNALALDLAVDFDDAFLRGVHSLGGQELQRVKRHSDVAAKDLQKLQVGVGEGVRLGAFDVERADGFVVQLERHGERAFRARGAL